MKILTAHAGKCFLKDASSLSGLEGEEGWTDLAVERTLTTQNMSQWCDSNTHVATDDSDFHPLLSVLLSSS